MIKNTTQSGFFIVDKPQDITSHDAVATIRRVTGIKKVGHTGTLDPFATGILLIPIQSATRLAPYTHNLKKTYQATITLGATSNTDDNTGTITHTSDNQPTLAEIEVALKQFRGQLKQLPPQYAAIKIKGKKMYEYAREGKQVEVQARDITIDTLEIISYTYPHLIIRTTVSTGTYIRALARDIGEALKTGAHLSTLRRTSIGKFDEKSATPLNTINKDNWPQYLHRSSELIAHMPSVILESENVAKFQQGREVLVKQPIIFPLDTDQPIAVLDPTHHLIGIGLYTTATTSLFPKTVLTF